MNKAQFKSQKKKTSTTTAATSAKKIVKKTAAKKITKKKSPIATQQRSIVTSTSVPRSVQSIIQTTQTISQPLSSSIFSSKNLNKNKKSTFTSSLSSQLLTKSQRLFSGWGYSHYVPEEEVERRIMDILSAIPAVNKDKLTKTAHLQYDLGLDSLQQVEFIIMLEGEFKIEINDDDAGLITRVDHATHYFSHTPYAV